MISHRPEITKMSDSIIDLKEHNLKKKINYEN